MASTGNASASTAGAVKVPANTNANAAPWWSYWPALLIALAFAPILAVHARVLWSRPHYQLFPLVVPGALALAYRYARGLGVVTPGERRLAMGGAIAGWALLAFGIAFVSPPVGMVGALVTLMAAVYALGGRKLALALLPAWGFLWLAVPLPHTYDMKVVTGLQNLVSRWSSQLLDALGIFHVMEGNIVELAGKRLLVDQACSGIYSLLTLLMGAVFYALWTRTGWVRGLVLLGSAIFWVVAGNVARIVSIVILYDRWGIDASGGKKHEALGILLFLGMLLMVASTDRLYSFAASLVRWAWQLARRSRAGAAGRGHGRPGAERPSGRGEAEGVASPPRTALPPLRKTWVGTVPWGVAFGLLILPQYMMPGVNWREVLVSNDVYGKPFEKLVGDTLPAEWPPRAVDGAPFLRMGFSTEHRQMDDSWGENSRIWTYRQGPRTAAVSVDFQFVDWHDLRICYSSKGWQVVGRRVVPPDGVGQPTLVIIDMLDPQGSHGMVVYGMYLVDGTPVVPPDARGYIQSLAGRLLGWFRDSARSGAAVARVNHQIQLFIEGDSPLTPAERERAIAFFDHARSIIQGVGLGVKGGTR